MHAPRVQRINSLLQRAFDCAQDGMGLADCEGRVVRVNPSFCQITGYSEAELRGRNFREITHPDDREGDRTNVNKLIRGEISSYQREKRYLHKNGSVIWIAVTAWLVRDESGKPLGLTGHVHEVAQRKTEGSAEVGEGQSLSSQTGPRVFKAAIDTYRKKTLLEKMPFALEKTALTKREQEVATLLANGKTNKQIASALGISPRTVEVHRAAVNWKMRPAAPVAS